MTLENFFTLTELKDGLTTPTRVTELLTVMQNEKENIGKSTSDTTRQWSAVATVIAATENKECLDLFVQLDGLWFIDKYLKDAQNVMNDSGNGVLDELIILLLRGLERLQVDHQRSVGSGIGSTVKGLLGHSSLAVQEKAKGLCERWAPVEDADVASTNLEQSVCSDSVQREPDEDVRKAEMIMKFETENDASKLEGTPSMGISGPLEDAKETGISEPLEDVKEKQEVDCLTLTSDIDVDHGVEPVTKTETMEDIADKDEEMVDGGESRESQSPDNGNNATKVDTTSGIGGSASGGGSRESPDVDSPKTKSDTESDEVDGNEKKDDGIESADGTGSPSRFSKWSTKSRDDDLISKRPSDMDLDYGMVDPLALARQVANEVELEVDSPEQSSSTSTSTDENEHDAAGGSAKEVSSGPGPSPKGSPGPVEADIRVIQINETGQEPGLNPDKGFSGFDLNLEVSSDEIETETETNRPVDQILTPISVVSASRATAADGLPAAPLQFEGALGWKGSAATSAFRRIPEGEKTYSSSSSHNNSNPRSNFFDFDLNVTESSDDKILDFLSRDKAEDSSGLQLDLNSLGDIDAGFISLDWKGDGRARQNGTHGAHGANSLSSSSMQLQPSYKNLDLNLNDPFFRKSFNTRRDEPEPPISIFGTQVEVNRNEYIPHHYPPPPPPQPTNGRNLEPSVDFSLGRPGSSLGIGPSNPYANLPAYGYGHNGYSMGPMYAQPGAPIPYMVDSRGPPLIPPIPPAYSQPTQPFFFNMAASSAPYGSNGAGPSRNSLDLNPGFMTEMGNRENHINNNNMGLRQFFNHNQASSSSVIGRKREEPDSGWELFPMNYEHQHPPWQ